MSNEILENLGRAVDNVNVPPINPRVLGLQGSGQQIVSGSAHGLPARALGLEPVSVRDILAEMEAEIFLHNGGTSERDIIRSLLNTFKFGSEDRESIVLGVADEEGEVNQSMGVGKLGKKLKVLGKVRSGVL
jgi:hypothetical protein